MRSVLIAGMGNVLRSDDGFGVEVARHLARYAAYDGTGVELRGSQDNHSHEMADQMSQAVKVIEVGIGGIHLVQELMAGYDVLVIVDAMERGSLPGTVHVLEAEVEDLDNWPADHRADFLADMHYATPSKAMILAKALGILPRSVFLVGCQPVDTDDLGIGLSDPVARAVGVAVSEIEKIVAAAATGQ